MKNENRLVKKVKRLLRRLGCPRWLHHYGPKTYEFLEHLCALFVRWQCRLSYRRVKDFFDLLGMCCPSKSALQYTAARLDTYFWQRVLALTCGPSYLVALDSTRLSRTNPSYHYLHRIDASMPRLGVQVSVAFDTRKKRFCTARIRVLPRHDIMDAAALITNSKPKVIVADKAYDANWLHELCMQKNVRAHIPLRRWNKPRRTLGARVMAASRFNARTYRRRALVEAAFSSLKRKYGSSVSAKKSRTIRTDIYGRLASHNIFDWLFRYLGQSRCRVNVYKS